MRRSLVSGGATLGPLAATALTWIVQAALPLTAHHQDLTPLEAGRVIERHLERGAEHRYAVALGAGEYALVIVDQRGIDLVAQARGPDEA